MTFGTDHDLTSCLYLRVDVILGGNHQISEDPQEFSGELVGRRVIEFSLLMFV